MGSNEPMSNQPPTQRRRAAQPRAEATRRAIREASLRILRDEGPARLTTNRIVEVAGVSIGTLYHHYRDKYAIAAEICDELLLADVSKLDGYTRQTLAMVRVSLDETLHFFIREQVARHRTLYRQLKDFYLSIHWRYDLDRWVTKYRPERPGTIAWLPTVFEFHRKQLAVRDFELAAAMVVNAISGTIHATLDSNPELILDDRFCDELLALVLGYLKSPASTGKR